MNFEPATTGMLRQALEHVPAETPVHVHVSTAGTGTMHRAPLLSVHTAPAAVELGGANPPATVDAESQVPAERLDLTGRDPATITPIELLAFAYPDVYALMKEHAADETERRKLLALCEDRIAGVQRELARIDIKRNSQLEQVLQQAQLAAATEEAARAVAERVDELLADRDRLRARVEAALALVDDLLRPWATARPVHPGYAGLAAGNQRVADVQAWRDRRDELAHTEPR